MAKYLVQASYTTAGAKRLLETGATERKKAIEAAVEKLGGQRVLLLGVRRYRCSGHQRHAGSGQ